MAIRKRGPNHYEVVVYAGIDPATGKQRQISRTVRGPLKAAKAKAHELASDQKTGSDVPFSSLLRRWQSTARHESSTGFGTSGHVKRITERWGPVPICDIRPADLDAWYVQLEQGYSEVSALQPTTIRRIHGIISAALEQAVAWGWLETNPARRARPPEGGRTPPVVPSVPEVTAALDVLWAHDRDLWAFVRVSAATGMRRGEVCALRASDVLPGALRKAGAIGIAKGGSYHKTTKTGVVHLIAVDRRTEAVLRWQAWRKRTLARKLDVELDPDHYLWSAEVDCGRAWYPGWPSHRFRELVGPGIQLRTLRHFVASQLIGGGADITTVAARLGHARTSTTLDVYAGLLPASDRDAATRMGRTLGR